eukprot:5368269-Pleurochrysis_carterae.AAC.1
MEHTDVTQMQQGPDTARMLANNNREREREFLDLRLQWKRSNMVFRVFQGKAAVFKASHSTQSQPSRKSSIYRLFASQGKKERNRSMSTSAQSSCACAPIVEPGASLRLQAQQ